MGYENSPYYNSINNCGYRSEFLARPFEQNRFSSSESYPNIGSSCASRAQMGIKIFPAVQNPPPSRADTAFILETSTAYLQRNHFGAAAKASRHISAFQNDVADRPII
ncbi:hypothetical protein DI09_23p100 [Mitosporidium daphniae]|uniref:Uncharacterized protein n=1 Tax=Mitosporidium daphniae TaxID=1485682 RepID=A0A098VSK2_9MICR|nr:uncharacterized protein DI09_23p100 [Mitosporidium daphniae]KGG51935.1 hypothetical protein DI09_23p100 [Mitosporidium daphniae]|eukprot:XP_013238362.1 uncharacterized protein DI09_23p100 [Mitosporidium daphniae]